MSIMIAGYSGSGKTYVKEQCDILGIKVKDSDSSNFDKANFPQNYIEDIKKNIESGEYAYIFVSTHKEVIEALIAENIEFTLVYPKRTSKAEYIRRWTERGSDAIFIQKMNDNWDTFIDDCESYDCHKIALDGEEYLQHFLKI